MRTLKMVIVMRTDLNMRKGKMIAQGAHAAMMMFAGRIEQLSLRDIERQWFRQGMTKICVRADSWDELIDIGDKASNAGLAVWPVMDAGFTEFHGEPTLTCLAIGPDEVEKLDQITGHLKLL